MDSINVSTKNDTYVLSKCPSENFSKDLNLWVGNRGSYGSCKLEEDIAQTLIKFDLEYLKNTGIVIKQAYVQLYVENYDREQCWKHYELAIRVNQTPFDVSQVNYVNKPTTADYKVVKISVHEIEAGCINLDITDLANAWLNDDIPNNGITLIGEKNNFFLQLGSSRSGCGPSFIGYYDVGQVQERGGGMQLQVQNKHSVIIFQGQPILFDVIITPDDKLMTYDITTGEITIKKTGFYFFEWWMALEGAGLVDEITLQLQSVDQSVQIGASAAVNPLAQITGNAVVNITTAPQRFSLVNNSGGAVQLADSSIQGSIIVGKIS